MKKLLSVISCVMAVLPSVTCFSQQLFYYAGNEKYPLTPVYGKRAILRPESPNNNANYVERVGARISVVNQTINNQVGQRRIAKKDNGELSLPIFKINNKGADMILRPEIILKPKASFTDVNSLVNKYNLTLTEKTRLFQIYSAPAEKDVITIANELYETGNFEYVCPNFFCPSTTFAYIPNDPYFQYQVTCHNVGQVFTDGHTGTPDADIDAPEAWEITKGSPDIIVAVYDEGVTTEHPDLPNYRQVRLKGSNFGSGNPNDPSPTGNSNHGNACAGVIAATMDNNEGIAGIAPNCKIMPLRWDVTTAPEQDAKAISFAVENGARIISCSFGKRSPETNLFPVLTDAIADAIKQGVVVIFAAGNEADRTVGDPGYVCFPGNASIPNLITVGASDRYDSIAKYSPSSTLIDIVAPSHRAYNNQIPTESGEMWTLDMPGEVGYNPVDRWDADRLALEGSVLPSSGINHLAYTGRFGGTSHACPVVAGVVALMLSVNPFLTPAQVYDILKNTCDKVGGYAYKNGRCNEMGYGRVNAYKAVCKAKEIVAKTYIEGTYNACSTSKFYIPYCSSGDYTIDWKLTNSSLKKNNIITDYSPNKDTVYIHPFLSPEQSHYGSNATLDELSATITNSKGSIIATSKATLIPTMFAPPCISASSDAFPWYGGSTRTFSVENCQGVPDSQLEWTVEYIATANSPKIPFPTSFTRNYTGRTISFTAPKSSVGRIDTVKITVADSKYVCGNVSQTLVFPVTAFGRIGLKATDLGNRLNVSIVEETEDENMQTLENAELKEDSEYSLELWNSMYGRMATQPANSSNEQINTSGMPQGVYAITLKENGEVVAQTKVMISK